MQNKFFFDPMPMPSFSRATAVVMSLDEFENIVMEAYLDSLLEDLSAELTQLALYSILFNGEKGIASLVKDTFKLTEVGSLNIDGFTVIKLCKKHNQLKELNATIEHFNAIDAETSEDETHFTIKFEASKLDNVIEGLKALSKPAEETNTNESSSTKADEEDDIMAVFKM